MYNDSSSFAVIKVVAEKISLPSALPLITSVRDTVPMSHS